MKKINKIKQSLSAISLGLFFGKPWKPADLVPPPNRPAWTHPGSRRSTECRQTRSTSSAESTRAPWRSLLCHRAICWTREAWQPSRGLVKKQKKAESARLSHANGGFFCILSYLPAPHNPEGLRPLWMLSLFILWTTRSAVMATSCFFSPNSSLPAKRIMYRQGSAIKIITKNNLD